MHNRVHKYTPCDIFMASLMQLMENLSCVPQMAQSRERKLQIVY